MGNNECMSLAISTFTEGLSPVEEQRELKPILRWAGGKRQLLDRIHSAFPEDFNLGRNRFFEPFIGGGALTFSLASGKFGMPSIPNSRTNQIVIGDQNPQLVNVYRSIRDHVNELITRLSDSSTYADNHETYYKVRDTDHGHTGVESAARFIYLNRLCFNGLYRVNSKGNFNVPYGRITAPTICDERLLYPMSQFLQNVDIELGSFDDTTATATNGDLVYFDPPYIPLSATASFTKYSIDDFAEQNHIELMECIKRLVNRGVNVILSNSHTDKTCEIYGTGELNLYSLSATRSISASGKSRKRTSEILGLSYDISHRNGLLKLSI
jgi:DNA adenine methylase